LFNITDNALPFFELIFGGFRQLFKQNALNSSGYSSGISAMAFFWWLFNGL